MLKIRRSWDCLLFNMGISILVRQHLYIEMPPQVIISQLFTFRIEYPLSMMKNVFNFLSELRISIRWDIWAYFVFHESMSADKGWILLEQFGNLHTVMPCLMNEHKLFVHIFVHFACITVNIYNVPMCYSCFLPKFYTSYYNNGSSMISDRLHWNVVSWSFENKNAELTCAGKYGVFCVLVFGSMFCAWYS